MKINFTKAKGLRMNIGKTKVMVSGKSCGDVERQGMWPCKELDRRYKIVTKGLDVVSEGLKQRLTVETVV